MAKLTGISLIAVEVELIGAGGCANILMSRDGIHPRSPSASFLWIWPSAIRFQHKVKPDDPRRNLNIHKGNLRAHEEGPMGMRRRDQLVEVILKALCIADLLLLVLLLQQPIEAGDDLSVDLYPVSSGHAMKPRLY